MSKNASNIFILPNNHYLLQQNYLKKYINMIAYCIIFDNISISSEKCIYRIIVPRIVMN